VVLRSLVKAVGFVAGSIIAAGCSNSDVPGSATAQLAEPGGNFGTNFNACNDLTDGDLRAYGLDPSTKQDATAKLAGLGQGCEWAAQNVLIAFGVGGRTVNELKADPRYYHVESIQIGGRESVRIITEPAPGICGIGMPTGSASVVVSLTIKHKSLPTAGDPCALVTDIANKFVTKLPK